MTGNFVKSVTNLTATSGFQKLIIAPRGTLDLSTGIIIKVKEWRKEKNLALEGDRRESSRDATEHNRLEKIREIFKI